MTGRIMPGGAARSRASGRPARTARVAARLPDPSQPDLLGLEPDLLSQLVRALATTDPALARRFVETTSVGTTEPASRARLTLFRLGTAVAEGDEETARRLARDVVVAGRDRDLAVALPVLDLWRALTGRGLVGPTGSGSAAATAARAGVAERLVRTLAVLEACGPLLTGGVVDVAAVDRLARPREALLRPPPDEHRDVVLAAAALAGAVLGDDALCRGATLAVEGREGRFVTLGQVVVLGPVGWFAAHAHAAGDRLYDALAASTAALSASRRAGYGTWTVLCLLQRADLLAGRDPAESAAAAREALHGAQDLGLDVLAARARTLAPEQAPRARLSPAQQRVLGLAASGLTNDRIAVELGVSRSTVEKHMSEVYRRLEVPNRAASVRWWVSQRAG